MKNAVYFQSGGPTSVINSSFYGVIKGCFENKDKIDKLFGSRFGVKGLIKNDLIEINKPLEHYQELTKKNGAILGTARLKLKENDDRFEDILNTVKINNIGYIFCNGGNDSMDTGNKLNKLFKERNIDCKVIGIPKTMDNDLVEIDHAPGFGSACKFVCEVVKGLYQDINSYDETRINVVEVLCRDSGWVAACAKGAAFSNMAPDFIYVPEVPFSIEKFLDDVKKAHEIKDNLLIVVAKTIVDKDGKLIAPILKKDAFGHEYLGNVSDYLVEQIGSKLNLNARASILDLFIRDLVPLNSKVDVEEAKMCGEKAVEFILENKTGMVTIIRDSSSPYKVHYSLAPLDVVANGVKYFDKAWINEEGNNINDSYLDYIKPFLDLEDTQISKDLL